MKKSIKYTLVLSFVVFLIFGCMTAFETNTLKKHVDSFDGTTCYSAKLTALGWSSGNSYIEAVYYPSSERYSLYVEYHGNDWIFMDQLEISINQTIQKITIEDPSRETSGGVVYEREEVGVSRQILKKMASSEQLKFRITGSDGSVILKANSAGKEALIDLLSEAE